jgi:4-hydroxy-2-oxoheptanedioate aldolase
LARDPLREKLKDGRTAVGVWASSPELVELCGFIGFDWVMIDQMFTANDWQRTEELIRAAEAAGITPVVRIQSNPWLGYDHRIAVDVARAIGIGAQFMLVSNSGHQEVEECLVAARDWHRRALTLHPYRDVGVPMPGQAERNAPAVVIPQPETNEGLASLEGLITDPGISAVFIGMTDAGRALTGEAQPDFYDPRVWSYVDQAVELGRSHDVVVGANTSYGYSLAELRKRVETLHQHGVRMIMIQGATFIFQVAAGQLLRDLAPIID